MQLSVPVTKLYESNNTRDEHRRVKASSLVCPQELAGLGLDFSFIVVIGVMAYELLLTLSFPVSKLERLYFTSYWEDPLEYT